jgi:hypothetical protein
MFLTNEALLLGLYQSRCDLVRLKFDIHAARIKENEILSELERRGIWDCDIEEEMQAVLTRQLIKNQSQTKS